jgi:hypothetical protein
MKEIPLIPINHLHGMTLFISDIHPGVALPAENLADKKVIQAKPVSLHCQTKSLKPFLTSHNPVITAASLSANLTRVFPLKSDRYGKSRKSNHQLSNTSSIEQPALADTQTALTSLIGCTLVQGKTSRRLSLRYLAYSNLPLKA